MKMKHYVGINIQYPISRLIPEGKKTIETRSYPIPPDFIGTEMAIIETPGRNGRFKARIVGLITFGDSFRYRSSDDFYKDTPLHCVDSRSEWKWTDNKAKWGWPILNVRPLSEAKPAPLKKGIKYTKGIALLARDFKPLRRGHLRFQVP
jgi:hypothetical protein